MVKLYGSGKNHNRDPIPQRLPESSAEDSETSQRTQVSAASALSQSSSSSSSTLSTRFSGRVVSKDSGSSAAKRTQKAAEPIMPEDERKEPFDDSLIVRSNSDSSTSEAAERSATDQISQLPESRECEILFSHILNNLKLTDEEKLLIIREQMKQEVEVFELPYKISVVRDITKYVSRIERRYKIALSEIDFAKALVERLPQGTLQVDNLKTECTLILGLGISKEKKAQELSRAITTWQRKNPNIVKDISSISLKGENIKVIPRYIAKFTNLKELNLSDNDITDISPLATLVELEELNLGGNKIIYPDILANLVKLNSLTLNKNRLPNRTILIDFPNLSVLHFQEQPQAPSRREPEIDIRRNPIAASVNPVSSRGPVSQASSSSTDESLESKEPFDDPMPRPNAIPQPRRPGESYDSAMLNELLEPAECQELFRYIVDNPGLTDEQRLFAIRRQMQLEAKVFGLPYSSEVNDIIRYVSSAERKHQIALAESTFAKALIDELLEKGHQVGDLQAKYNSIMAAFENKLIPNEEEKAQRISNAIADWQRNNSGIVANISSISLEGKNIKVIPQYIAGFTNLKELHLSHNNITDVSALAALVELKKLFLSDNNIADVSALTTLVELKTLFLSNNNITDVSALKTLVELKGLYLEHNNITDVSALKTLVKLENLGLSNNNITDVSALAALVKLKRLWLWHNNITDVSALKTLVELHWLDLRNNNITDVSALAALVELEWLYLSGNNITDVSALAALVELKKLHLEHNNITNVSALRTLVKLKILWLTHNNITDISALRTLVKLENTLSLE